MSRYNYYFPFSIHNQELGSGLTGLDIHEAIKYIMNWLVDKNIRSVQVVVANNEENTAVAYNVYQRGWTSIKD